MVQIRSPPPNSINKNKPRVPERMRGLFSQIFILKKSVASWDFIWTPILLGSILMVFCTVIYNNLVPGRTYPQNWL
ncbi:MAG: HPP family protein [Planktothrix sp.]|uniref:HPP family protein n=1 Tax=Planktothrix sp. TaxID=3088171 RepID=UPI0038D3F19E